jgi:hypothetical protein
MMCVFKLNKLKPGSTSITVETDIYKKYEETMGGTTYEPDKVGTYPNNLALILNQFTEGTWSWHKTPVNEVPKTLLGKVGLTPGLGPVLDVEPVILGVDWDLAGAHWVVVDTIRESNGIQFATVCDPWDANVHMQRFAVGGPFYYDAASGGFMINVWDATKGDAQPYQGNAARGQVKTWGMIYRD